LGTEDPCQTHQWPLHAVCTWVGLVDVIPGVLELGPVVDVDSKKISVQNNKVRSFQDSWNMSRGGIS